MITSMIQYTYQILEELEIECEDYLRIGMDERYLYHGNRKEHIKYMINLWNRLPWDCKPTKDMPIDITMNRIEELAQKMDVEI